MAEGVTAGVALMALGLLGAWQFSPAVFSMLVSLAITTLGAWLALGTTSIEPDAFHGLLYLV